MLSLVCLKSVIYEADKTEAFINACFEHLGYSDSVQLMGSSLEGDWYLNSISKALTELAFLDAESLVFIAKTIGIGEYLAERQLYEGGLNPAQAELKQQIEQSLDPRLEAIAQAGGSEADAALLREDLGKIHEDLGKIHGKR